MGAAPAGVPGQAAAYSLHCVESTPERHVAGSVGGYALLVLFGVMLGVLGCFEYSRSAGPVPVAALVSCAVVFAACWLAGIGMGTALGGLAIALGWLFASFVLTLPTPGGSVIVTNTAAGKWYLYGGAVAAAIGTVLGIRTRRRPRGSPPAAPPSGGSSADGAT